MHNSFAAHEQKFNTWKEDGYPGVNLKTAEFIRELQDPNKKTKLWKHQLEGLLRIIYAYEILHMQNVLLNIVTGGGKTAIIASVMFWLKTVHGFNKFLVLTPNTIVRARLEVDFAKKKVFDDFEFASDENLIFLNELDLHVIKDGNAPQGILESGIILANIQQLYPIHARGKRNVTYLHDLVGKLAVFNDEAHNTSAEEYTNVLNYLSENCQFRLDTTATPDRADGQEPDSDMIYQYDVSKALDDGIIKSVVVYQPEVKLLKMTYTNPQTGEKKDITELDSEFSEAEKSLKPFQWILDSEPMKKQIHIALQRHNEQKIRSRRRYKPILFVVTMSVEEGQRVQKILQNSFMIRTLLITEESDEEQRDEAIKIGKDESEFEAVVSVLMLREGWDVPEVSTILLLRKFSSEVYGQQVIGRGLRKILRNSDESEILCVIDHPRLQHDWLWELISVSKIKQNVRDDEVFDPDEDVPHSLTIQKLVNPENLIKIPDPEYHTTINFPEIDKEIPYDRVENEWDRILNNMSYDKERITITKTKIETVHGFDMKNKIQEEHMGVNDEDLSVSGEYKRDVLEDLFKKSVLKIAAEVVQEAGFGPRLRIKVYRVMMEHIQKKIFSNKPLSDANKDDIEFAINIMPNIKNNFAGHIVAGIVIDK